ncbi:mechanosensitive ion channel family protein [Alterisphingorhabdus coralli]|uniref:Mechanosensitive ion channel n=1 Tax=Alterisphingorhabdus coralli TaxID=3071408 RepID=A0AA97FAK4_9SPHN|nr:mechanosensitive ion channel domain-containing protein [Parasphingorhabdus sp. SCSIO 66989]WOE76208.1 mechanosensitive ion channel [Parasphingorhabdus sp. SCSIO 66989]
MIEQVSNRIQSAIIDSPGDLIYVQGVIAMALVVLAITIGWYVGRSLGPFLARMWENRAGYESELAQRRIRNMCRQAVIFILCSIFLSVYRWEVIAHVIFALTIAITVGLFSNNLIRGVRMPGWLGTVIGLLMAAGTVIGLVNEIEAIYIALESVGINFGTRRITLWWVATIIVTAVIFFAIARVVIKVASHIINNMGNLDSSQKVLAQKLATVAILAIAFVLGLDILGIDLTALAVFSGAFGLAIGFGMQKTVGNLIAGIILLMDRSIKPGDIIVVGDSFGWVNKIGVRAVSVLTRDGKEHLIPNENLMTTEVENWSYSDPNVRMKIPVGVSYGSDMKLVQKLLLKAVNESPRVLKNPKPVAWLLEFGDNSVNFEIRAWINDPHKGVGNVRGDIMMRVWDLLKENDVEIPFPQRDLHLRSIDESAANMLMSARDAAIEQENDAE